LRFAALKIGPFVSVAVVWATAGTAIAADVEADAAVAAEAQVSGDGIGDPAAPQALGRVFTAGPTPRALQLASSGGYGYTESVLHTGDSHQRAAGSLAVEGRAFDWLGLGLRFDGRYDRHQDGQTKDDGWVGDPRLTVRVDVALGPSLRAGARLGIWFPGRNAPSIDFGATTPELVGALTWAPRTAPVWLSVNGGYRLGRSARSAPDAAMLSASDRLALEVSAFDQVLLGLAAAYGAGRTQVFAELDAEPMIGSGSPSPFESPLRAGAGMRYAATANVRLEAEVEADVGGRPDLPASGPLVPVPPRAAVWLGVAYRFGGERPIPHHPAPPPAPVAPATTPAPAPVTLEGRVVGADGGALTETKVTIRGGEDAEAVAIDVDGEGRFTFADKPGRTLIIEAQAADHEPASQTVTLNAPDKTEVTLTLKRRLPGGQIRGLVRSFRGTGLDAEIKIEAGEQPPRTLHSEGGRFEVDVAPGAYDVTITAPGYDMQRRHVEVERNGVTLLNVDLRSAR